MVSNLCNICWYINSGINASEHFDKCFMILYILHLSQFWKPLLAYIIFWVNSQSLITYRAALQLKLVSICFADMKCRLVCGEFRNLVLPKSIKESWHDVGHAESLNVFLSKPQSKLGKLWCCSGLLRAFSSYF